MLILLLPLQQTLLVLLLLLLLLLWQYDFVVVVIVVAAAAFLCFDLILDGIRAVQRSTDLAIACPMLKQRDAVEVDVVVADTVAVAAPRCGLGLTGVVGSGGWWHGHWGIMKVVVVVRGCCCCC